MKGFALDSSGDIVIENNEISLVFGDSLLQQKVRSVLGTNHEEWFLDWDEGVDFDNLLGKGVNEELIRYEIEKGLAQVDSSFSISEFSVEIDTRNRTAKVSFKAQTSDGEEVGGEYTWA